MTDEKQVIQLLRAANPVPHHREAIRVVRETDPLWQTIQTRLTDDSWASPERPDPYEGLRDRDGDNDMSNATPMKSRRTWIGATAGVAAAALLLVLVMVVRPGGAPDTPDYVGSENLSQLPSYVATPDQIGAVVGASYASVRLSEGPPAIAPNDCTAIGLTDEVESHGYVAFTDSSGYVRSEVARFADANRASDLLARIREDIQDCDRSEHPSFGFEFEAVTEGGAGDEAFVLSVISDGGDRDCWSWVQDGDRIAVTAMSVLPAPSLDRCVAVAELTADTLGRG